MRDLKFKAWHNGRKQMFWFDVRRGNHGRGDGYIGMVDWGKEYHSEYQHRGNVILVDPEDCELMQFTGLLDKNGKEIYEGDILRIHNSEEDDGMGENYKYTTVEFKNGAFKVEYDFGDYDMTAIGWAIDIWNEQNTTCEIIGNIYESPELLNSDKEDQRSVARDDDSSTNPD